MTALDTRARATALRLINKYGRSVTLVKKGAAAYNRATGVATNVPASYTVKAVESVPSERHLSQGVAQGSTILTIAAAALTVEPAIGDTITDGGVTWTVTKPLSTSSGELKCLWEVAVTR